MRRPARIMYDHQAVAASTRMRFVVTLNGRPLAGTNCMERAMSLLACFSRDGELDGYAIKTRGGGR